MRTNGVIQQRDIKDADGYPGVDIIYRVNKDGSIELQQHRDVVLITKERLAQLKEVVDFFSPPSTKTDVH